MPFDLTDEIMVMLILIGQPFKHGFMEGLDPALVEFKKGTQRPAEPPLIVYAPFKYRRKRP
jgi:hypothetical protein